MSDEERAQRFARRVRIGQIMSDHNVSEVTAVYIADTTAEIERRKAEVLARKREQAR